MYVGQLKEATFASSFNRFLPGHLRCMPQFGSLESTELVQKKRRPKATWRRTCGVSWPKLFVFSVAEAREFPGFFVVVPPFPGVARSWLWCSAPRCCSLHAGGTRGSRATGGISWRAGSPASRRREPADKGGGLRAWVWLLLLFFHTWFDRCKKSVCVV